MCTASSRNTWTLEVTGVFRAHRCLKMLQQVLALVLARAPLLVPAPVLVELELAVPVLARVPQLRPTPLNCSAPMPIPCFVAGRAR